MLLSEGAGEGGRSTMPLSESAGEGGRCPVPLSESAGKGGRCIVPLSEGVEKGGKCTVTLSEGRGKWCPDDGVLSAASTGKSPGWVPGACVIGGKTLEADGGVGIVTGGARAAGAVDEPVVEPAAGAVITGRAGTVIIVAGAGGGGGGAGGSVAAVDGAVWLSES